MEYLGVYNNDNKKINDDINNSSENESDFEKRFFDNENNNTKEVSNILNNKKNKTLMNDDIGFINDSYKNSYFKLKDGNKFGNEKSLNNKECSYSKLKIKHKKKLIKLSKNNNLKKEENNQIIKIRENEIEENHYENINVIVRKEEYDTQVSFNEKSPLKNPIKNEYPDKNNIINFNNSNMIHDDNRTFDRVEFFKKLRSNSLKDNHNNSKDENKKSLNEWNSVQQTSLTNINNNNNDLLNSKIFNFSEMGSKLKSNLSLTFNPNNSNKSANNNTNNLNTNLLINQGSNFNPIASNVFNLSNSQNDNILHKENYFSKKNHQNLFFEKNSLERKTENSQKINLSNQDIQSLNINQKEKIIKPTIICYTNELISSINKDIGLKSNSSSKKNSPNGEIMINENKIVNENNFPTEFSFKKISTKINTIDYINHNNLIADSNNEYNHQGIIKITNNQNLKDSNENKNVTPSIQLKTRNYNSNNTPKKVKRIPFVRLTPERIQKEKQNVPKTQIPIGKTNSFNIPATPNQNLYKDYKNLFFRSNSNQIINDMENINNTQNSEVKEELKDIKIETPKKFNNELINDLSILIVDNENEKINILFRFFLY